MLDAISCHACGASNAVDAPWCTLCFAPFPTAQPGSERGEPGTAGRAPDSPDTARLSDPPEPPASPARLSRHAAPGEQLSLIADDRRTWQCRFCETRVALTETECPACQQSIYDTFGGSEAGPPPIDQAAALRWAAAPGAAHIRLGQGILGVSIGLAILISAGFGMLVMTSGKVAHGSLLVFIALTTWLASIHDVFRITRNEPDEVLLRPRVISVLAGVVFMVIVAASVSAQSVISP